MDARDYLRLAQKWVAGSMEGEWRSAVSRAYYAAFHIARRLLLVCGFVVPRADRAHAYLWRRLANCGALNVREAGSLLNILRGERTGQITISISHSIRQMLTLVQRAEKVILAFEKAAKEPLKTQITEAIRTYDATS